MENFFEEPKLECVNLSDVVVFSDDQVPGGDLGVNPSNPFPEIP